MKVVFATPSLSGPYDPYQSALKASVPHIKAAGWEEGLALEIGNPYISMARAVLIRRALEANADVIVFLDHDVSWGETDLLKLLETPGDVVAGTYRFKYPNKPEEYMGAIFSDDNGRPIVRADGCIKAQRVPAGFLKITRQAVEKFKESYPGLVCGLPDVNDPEKAHSQMVDVFNHGAHDGVWYGEDYAFSRRWIECGGELWIVPNLNITHWDKETPYHGNFHEFLLRQPGGSKSEVPNEIYPPKIR